MTVLRAVETATIWSENGIPSRLVWRGRRWRVTDTPTRLEGEPVFHEVITHPLSGVRGWRFQVTDDGGETWVVDVRPHESGWRVDAVYC